MRAKPAFWLALVILLGTSGCYLGHVAAGQARLLGERRDIVDVLADPATSPEVAASLRLVLEARDFASVLGLEAGDQYTSYVDWPGDRIVTTVVASEPGSVEPAGFFFPIVGTVPYKGFFDRERAAEEAAGLRDEGLDVCEVAVPAYSTLGWLDDPVTAPMLLRGDPALVEIILHELVHATVYVASHADFNEGIAKFIGQEASIRFFDQRDSDDAAPPTRRAQVAEGRLIDAEVLGLRQRIKDLYATEPEGPARFALRQTLESEARTAIARLPLATRDATSLSSEMRLNDACLALRGTYAADIERYGSTLAGLEGDLRAFVDRLRSVEGAQDPRSKFFEPTPIHAAR
jgi:predicted aminopeptidase